MVVNHKSFNEKWSATTDDDKRPSGKRSIECLGAGGKDGGVEIRREHNDRDLTNARPSRFVQNLAFESLECFVVKLGRLASQGFNRSDEFVR